MQCEMPKQDDVWSGSAHEWLCLIWLALPAILLALAATGLSNKDFMKNIPY